MTKNDMTKLHVFLNKSLKQLMKMYWPMKLKSNEKIRNRANISTISEQIYQQRWRFISCILRMKFNQHPMTAITWSPERKRRRARDTWRRIAKDERTALGFTSWHGAVMVARDRVVWRRRIPAPIPPGVVDKSESDPIGHVRYINILTWLRGFRVKIANFSSFFCLSIPQETWIQRKQH